MINELKTALKTKDLSSYHKRIQAVYLRATNTPYKTIMEILDLSHDTIWRLTKKYLEDGLQALVSDARGGRRHAYMTVDEEQEFLSQQLSSAVKGEFITIDSLYEAYQEQLGRKTTKAGFYRLLKRNGWRKVSPRPEHPKKAEAGQKLTYNTHSESKLADIHSLWTIDRKRVVDKLWITSCN
ncbi:winged helix-turn-helix domain-containing protein [Streptococcus sp. 19428wA2_WM07]|nr:winged helix-turn-helix domain-containing protein [Streptococcus sp. 19428wA2_WM07]TFU25159.1 hypothetical protein E4T71_08740 [Streptococcus sp. WM07]